MISRNKYVSSLYMIFETKLCVDAEHRKMTQEMRYRRQIKRDIHFE